MRRVSGDDGVRHDVTRYDRPGADYGIVSDENGPNNHNVGTDVDAITEDGGVRRR